MTDSAFKKMLFNQCLDNLAAKGRSAAKQFPSPALLDELDEILATGCGILGKIGRLKEIARQLRAGNKKGAPCLYYDGDEEGSECKQTGGCCCFERR